MQYGNTNALFSTKPILFGPLGSTENPKIGSFKIESRIVHIKFIISPAVVHLQLKYILAVFSCKTSAFLVFSVCCPLGNTWLLQLNVSSD